MTLIVFSTKPDLRKKKTKLEDFQKITNAMYCVMDSTKLLQICKIWLSRLNETTVHGHVEQSTSKSIFVQMF